MRKNYARENYFRFNPASVSDKKLDAIQADDIAALKEAADTISRSDVFLALIQRLKEMPEFKKY